MAAMVIDMNEPRLCSLEQLKAFLDGMAGPVDRSSAPLPARDRALAAARTLVAVCRNAAGNEGS